MKWNGYGLRAIICLLTLSGTFPAGAQKILKDTTFVIVKQFQPTIADAFKIPDAPAIKDSVPPTPKIQYSIQSKKVHTPYLVEPIAPAKMVGEPLPRLFPGLVKAGAGTSLYGEAFYNNTRSKESSYGARIRHHSWNGTLKDMGPSGFSDNHASLYGKKFLHKSTLSGGLNFDRNVVHYYAYDTLMIKQLEDESIIRQHYATPSLAIRFQTHHTDTQKINADLAMKFYRLEDFYQTKETALLFSSELSGYYERQRVYAPLSAEIYNNRDRADTGHSVIVSLLPYIQASGKEWNTRIGVGIFVEGEQNDKSRFAFAPQIDFNYNILNNMIIPYAGITGGVKRNSLKSLAAINPFLVPSPGLKNTHTRVQVYGGVRGSLSKSVSYLTRASFSSVENICLYVNDHSRPFAFGFNTVYDNGTVLNLHGEIQYQHTEKIKLLATGDYNAYTLDTEVKPWHLPIWESGLSLNYNLKSKIVATAELILYGTRYSYTPSSNEGAGITVDGTAIHTMKPVLDANIGLEYRYSKKLSAFMNFNNLGFSSYERWNRYPTQKFNFLIGVTMAF